MPPEHVNLETVRNRKARLLDAFGEATVHEEREVVDGETFRELRELSRSGYTGGGYAWVVRDPADTAPLTESMPDAVEEKRAALMILGRGASRWGLPGGGREDGETYEEAAVREVREETGIECALTDLFLLRHRVTRSPEADARLHTLWVCFDAEYAGGHIEIQPGELAGAAWFDAPPPRMLPENRFRAAEFWPAYEAENPLAELEE